MSASGWHRRVLHSEGPTATAADRTIERTAIEAAGLGIRETVGLVTDDGAAFVPHRIHPE